MNSHISLEFLAQLKIDKNGTTEKFEGNWILEESEQKLTNFLVKCPSNDEFGLFIYGKETGDEADLYKLLWSFLIKVNVCYHKVPSQKMVFFTV